MASTNVSMKVLIPTDFSVQAEYAYIMAQKLSEKVNIETHFIHVLEMPDTVTMDDSGKISTCGEIDTSFVYTQKSIAERKLQQLKTLYGTHIDVHLVLGKVTRDTMKFAREHQFDLILMGTKGAWGLKEMLSGSEAQSIARRSKIPLLTLMCDRSDLKLEHLLLVNDFTKDEKADLSLLHKLLQAFGAQLHLLQVVSNPSNIEKKEVLDAMFQFASQHHLDNIETHLIQESDVEKGVNQFPQLDKMDIICIGTHGKGGIFHKSATEKLINHLFKPILSYPLGD